MSTPLIRYFLMVFSMVALLATATPADSQIFPFLWKNKETSLSKKPIYNTNRPIRSQAAPRATPRSRQEILQRAAAMRAPDVRMTQVMQAHAYQKFAMLQEQEKLSGIERDALNRRATQAMQNRQRQIPPGQQGDGKKVFIYNKPGLTKPPKVFTDYK